ncbi:hypothetical protein [Aureivirga marina]|uniref:hypothetical protein n=1 Tax=Aureivirga marina TaxID=1182451 RepID=UPI0018CA42CF|nr:hypothetical protein [Aureivirga marina]
MKILEIRVLPPIAIGRLGSAELPLEAYDLDVSPEKPLDFRKIIPKPSFLVDKVTGELSEIPFEGEDTHVIKFKDVDNLESREGKIFPVAPFLEVFAITEDEPTKLKPLTKDLLEQSGYKLEDITWKVDMGNIKIYRRTNDPKDRIYATKEINCSHEEMALEGECENFFTDANPVEGIINKLPLGKVQFIKPTEEYPEIRFRYTPAHGRVYGASRNRIINKEGKSEMDPVWAANKHDFLLYDPNKGTWRGYREGSVPDPTYTNPAQIFAGYDMEEDGIDYHVSWGYVDDECDGFISITIENETEETLSARAHVSAGPPFFAPDTLPIRVVSDELEQILLGPDVAEKSVPIEEAEEIIRRALETVRLMNTAIMNGNPFEGRVNVASTMVRQDTNDFGRLFEPIMATSIVDNLALRLLHERVFNGISTNAAPWFEDALRKPTKIGDLSNEERRRMPGMMRGADGRALCLTYRQIHTILKAASQSMFDEAKIHLMDVDPNGIDAADFRKQLNYRGKGNPLTILSKTAISNCFPGLEFDFRNLWRRALKGILLIENNNYVLDADEEFRSLIHHRLVGIEGKPTMVPTYGPTMPNGPSIPLITKDNPNGVSFMEWSNNMAAMLQNQGKKVKCYFTAKESPEEVVVTEEMLAEADKAYEAKKKKHKKEKVPMESIVLLNTISFVKDEKIPSHLVDTPLPLKVVELEVNKIFEGNSAAFTDTIIEPGDLTQGLCAPWQNDYRECACYYWAATRPDFVNVLPNSKGLSSGDTWMAKKRTGHYIPDNIVNSQLLSYDDLFINWEGELNFIVKGFDAISSDNELQIIRTKELRS